MTDIPSPEEVETEPLTSPDPIPENIAKLGELFPEAVTEDGVDLEVLGQLIGKDAEIADGEETYGLSWSGKRLARQIAMTPSTGTLRPAPEDSVDWDTTQNVVIEGDNLEVLKLLKSAYAGKVKLIYIDPPYNTGKDFVYKDDFKDNIANYLEQTGQVDEEGRRLSTNTETSGRFHTDWLNMMYPRLKLARDLLSDDGVLLVSIDDSELTSLSTLLNQLMGESNWIATLIWKSKSGGANDSRGFAIDHEYVVAMARDRPKAKVLIDKGATSSASFNREDSRGRYSLERLDKQNLGYQASLDFEIKDPEGNSYWPKQKNPEKPNARWRWSEDTVRERFDELVFGNGCVYTKNYEKDGYKPRSLMIDERFGRTRSGMTIATALMGVSIFDNPKPPKLIQYMSAVLTEDDDLILDFFAGSGTTGHAVMAQNAEDGGNRRYILVQLPEPLDPEVKEQKVAAEFCDELGVERNIAELTKERLRRAGEKIKEDNPDFEGDTGFRVFKLDSTNVKAWDPDLEDLEKTLEDSIETLKEGRDEEDVLYEVLLKLGLDLCVPIETRKIGGLEVSSIGAGTLFACMADELAKESVEELGQGILAWKDELDPAGDVTCLFKDGAFSGDQAKTNLVEILKQGDVKVVRCV